MRIAICEDDIIFQEELRQKIEKYYASLDVLISTYSSGEDLLKAMDHRNPAFDMIFMDIEMPGLDGLETSRIIHARWNDVPVIILTSHIDLAMEGYEVNAFRFLEKPIRQDKFQKALTAVYKRRMDETKIMVTDNGRNVLLSCREVMWLASENIHIRVMTTNGSYLIREKLKDRIAKLPKDPFFQIHRSYVVNLSYVHSFDNREVIMTNGSHLPVSRNRFQAFKTAMFHFIHLTLS